MISYQLPAASFQLPAASFQLAADSQSVIHPTDLGSPPMQRFAPRGTRSRLSAISMRTASVQHPGILLAPARDSTVQQGALRARANASEGGASPSRKDKDVHHVELDRLLRYRPRLQRLLRRGLDLPSVPRVRPPLTRLDGAQSQAQRVVKPSPSTARS